MIKKLSKEQYAKARHFLVNNARGIEKVLFQYEFESGDAEEVIKELRKFQNQDKGFGNALEPDLRCKESSALATTIAFQYLFKIKSEKKIELVKDCFHYFVKTYNELDHGWEIIPKEADNAPRAIWWNYNGINSHWGNPNAEILGYFYEYPQLIDLNFREKLTEHAIHYLNNICELSEMHEMFCYIRLSERLNETINQSISEKLDIFVENNVVKNPNERTGYCAVPLQVVVSPQSKYYEKFFDVITHDLDQLIETQTENGTWEPNWEWGRFEEEWKKAKQEWTGYITLNNLITLRDFNRIQFALE